MAIGSIFGSAKKEKKILFCPGTCSHWLDSQPSLYNYRGKHWFFSDLSYNRCFVLYIYIYRALCVLVIIAHILTHLSLCFYRRHISLSATVQYLRGRKKKKGHCENIIIAHRPLCSKRSSEVMNFKVKCPSASFTILLFHIGQAETVEGWRKRCSYHEKAKHEWANPPVT